MRKAVVREEAAALEAPAARKDVKPPAGVYSLEWHETLVAVKAKIGALCVLTDTLKKGGRLLMAPPRCLSTDAKIFWMKRYTVLTKERVTRLREVMELIQFKKDTTIKHEKHYAYVYAGDTSHTVHLCPLFWKAPARLGENSQPGTLIHEASHFLVPGGQNNNPIRTLVNEARRSRGTGVRSSGAKPDPRIGQVSRSLGTVDLAYGTGCRQLEVGSRGSAVRMASGQKEGYLALVHATLNADNVEYEFEKTLVHQGKYEQRGTRGKSYACCGETAEHSVCEKAVSRDFLKYYKDKEQQYIDIKKYEDALREAVKTMKVGTQKIKKSAENKEGDWWSELKDILKLCIDCVEHIQSFCEGFHAIVEKFTDFQCSDGEDFASSLSSSAKEMIQFFSSPMSSPMISCKATSASHHEDGAVFLQITHNIASLSGEVEKLIMGVNSIDGIGMFDV